MEEKSRFLDNPKNVKRLIWVFYVVCALLLATDLIPVRHHHTHAWEQIFGFYAFYGLGACVALVLIAKLMRKVVMRDEDYYDRDFLEDNDQRRESGHGH